MAEDKGEHRGRLIGRKDNGHELVLGPSRYENNWEDDPAEIENHMIRLRSRGT